MASERRSALIAPSASNLRRQLGPTAWFVFQDLLATSTGTTSSCEVVATTRSLAQALGLSKGTVSRALTKLRHAGLVEPVQDRTPAGAFTGGHYRLAVPDCVCFADRPLVPPTVANTPAERRPAKQRRYFTQLSLLDTETATL